eukprot:CAMPEP_0183436964 /NCGR_PEP_ID=MMETSP0370-20130417/70984_1 /TAXON_ID=268820 /ORGANISM="Peridinium aciculiferum, Strain PAER-2" /LENGTH=70 /DNA_ID=CAMNT_0025624593 /DNA_START=116 /DNA_END=325 /DNA_ORIENTATION=+
MRLLSFVVLALQPQLKGTGGVDTALFQPPSAGLLSGLACICVGGATSAPTILCERAQLAAPLPQCFCMAT